MWTIFGLYALYNCRTLRHLVRWLDQADLMKPSEVFDQFGAYCRATPAGAAAYWATTLEKRRQSEFAVAGRVVHEILHATRASFVEQLLKWVTTQAWWSMPEARVMLELDLLDCPYIYSNTELLFKKNGAIGPLREWKHFKFEQSAPRQLTVEVASEHAERVASSLFEGRSATVTSYVIDHHRKQMPLMRAKTVDDNAAYCHGMIQRSASIAAIWRQHGTSVAATP